MRLLPLGILFCLLLAGCTSAPEPTQPDPEPRVVVAVIDSGIDPYHRFFQMPDADVSGFTNSLDGEAPRTIRLSQSGSYDDRVAADADIWSSIPPRQLVHFAGTRILAISFEEDGTVLQGAGHGTGTAASVLTANPNATVVLVQGVGTADAEAWAASQPWVDLLSESYGPPLGVPGPVLGLNTSEANRLAWANGKLPVGASDNSPAPAPGDETAGPPWVLAVAGDNPETGCRQHVSGNAPDFTADFTQDLPRSGTLDETRSMSGTSFSTPMTAGSLSLAVLEVRRAAGHSGGIVDGELSPGLDNVAFRAALNRTAVYWNEPAVCAPPEAPVNPSAPWTQVGWGHVDPSVGLAAAAHLLGEEAPPKPAEAVAYMDAVHEARQARWG